MLKCHDLEPLTLRTTQYNKIKIELKNVICQPLFVAEKCFHVTSNERELPCRIDHTSSQALEDG